MSVAASKPAAKSAHSELFTPDRNFKSSGLPLTVLDTLHGNNVCRQHSHVFIEVVYFTEGESLHEYDGRRHVLRPGDVYAIAPGEPHAYPANRNARLLNCLFFPEALRSDLENLAKMEGFLDLIMLEPSLRPETGFQPPLSLDAATRLVVAEQLGQIIREVNQKAPGYEAAARAHLIQFLVTISRFHAQAGSRGGGAPERSDMRDKRELIRQCIHYISTHYSEDLRLEDLASLAFLSPEYFSKIFKRQTSQTPLEFINSLRMDNARHLLAGTQLSVTDIAYKTGHMDLNYFSRRFKQATGCTPGEYRRQARHAAHGQGLRALC
jgi:AraC family L-rhamnose operon regulatory protein RhaS